MRRLSLQTDRESHANVDVLYLANFASRWRGSVFPPYLGHANFSHAAAGYSLSTANPPTTENHYQGIFTELYRRFTVSSYKLLRREQYEPGL